MLAEQPVHRKESSCTCGWSHSRARAPRSATTWFGRWRRTSCRRSAGTTAFAGYVGLHDPDSQQAKGVIFFESKEAAEAAEETLAERRKGMAGGVGLTIESADLYEALVVDMEGVGG
jgi:hypothetical protein